MDLHDCCEEYADNCVSCNLHQSIRFDERRKIASLIAQEGPWCTHCKTYEHAISLATEGSSTDTVYTLNSDKIEIGDHGQAYFYVDPQDIVPPVTTKSVECYIDVDANGRVIGVEILNWPHTKEQD